MFYHTNKNTVYNTSDLWTSASSDAHQTWLAFTNFFFGAHTGSQAVTIFLAISGFVAAWGMLGKTNYDWVSYTIRRLARLLLPCYAVLAILVITGTLTNAIWGVNLHDDWTTHGIFSLYYWGQLFGSFDFIFGTPFALYPPMWTIKWILYFSLMLPAVFVLMLKAEKFFSNNLIAVWAGSSIISLIGFYCSNEQGDLNSLKFLPAFMIGVNLAMFYFKHPNTEEGRKNLKIKNNFALGAMLIIGLAIIKIPDYFFAFQGYTGQNYMGLWTVASLPILYAVLYFDPAIWFLSTRPLQWLGKISFSLFITHWALVGNSNLEAAIVNISSPALPISPWLVMVGCITIAWAFWKWVEVPLGKVSQNLGAKSAELVGNYFEKNKLVQK
jgi:peptidoglycan/LPS O-acetylase OafA/YrhL